MAASETENVLRAATVEKDPDSLSEKNDPKKAEEAKKRTPNEELRYFVAQGNEEKIRELHQQGADVNAPDEGKKPEEVPKTTLVREVVAPKITLDCPLHIAAENNHVKVISQLFYLGAKMETRNRIGSTPLHRAVSTGHVEAVSELINLGADVRAANNIGQTTLHIAVLMGNLEMVKLLLKHGAMADLRTKNKIHMTPIEYTLPNSETRNFLLGVDSSLRELLTDEPPIHVPTGHEHGHEHGHEEEKKHQ